MPISPRHLRIGGSVLIAVLMVAGGYVLPGLNAPKTKPVNAALTDELLASYITKDTDVDGLPDWQESLYGTDLNDPDSDGDGISDGEAVRKGLLTPTSLASQLPPVTGPEDLPGDSPAPGSFTEQFGREFFEKFISSFNGGEPPSEEESIRFVQNAVKDIAAQQVRPNYLSQNNVVTGAAGAEGLRSYAAAFEQLNKNNEISNNKTDIDFFSELVEGTRGDAVENLERSAAAYTKLAEQLTRTPTPPEAVMAHVDMTNAIGRLGASVSQMAQFQEDPLLGFVGLSAYSQNLNELDAALEKLAGVFRSNSLVLTEGAPGYYLYYLSQTAALSP